MVSPVWTCTAGCQGILPSPTAAAAAGGGGGSAAGSAACSCWQASCGRSKTLSLRSKQHGDGALLLANTGTGHLKRSFLRLIAQQDLLHMP
jgi:hypothetical protein